MIKEPTSEQAIQREGAPSSVDEEPHDDLLARARAWNRTRDPRTLWPMLDPSTLEPAADAIGATVAAHLRGERSTLGDATGSDAYAIGIAAFATGTGPLLGHWVEQGTLDVSDSLALVLARHLEHGRRRVVRMTRGAWPAFESLLNAGITPTVIKGFHTAHVYFPEPALRPMADVDIVVAPDDIEKAELALRAAAFTPSHVVERPYKRDWYPPDDSPRIWSFEVFDARERWKLELHDGANVGRITTFGFRPEDATRSGAPWQLNDLVLRAPIQPLLTVILAAHLSVELYPRRLSRLIELVYVLRRDCGRGFFSWDAFETLLDSGGAHRFVYPALALVEKLSPGAVDEAVLTRCRRASTRLTRVVADGFTPTRPLLEDRRVIAERLMWIANPRDGIRYLARWLNPVRGGTWEEVRDIYHARAHRLLFGHVSWRPPAGERREGGAS